MENRIRPGAWRRRAGDLRQFFARPAPIVARELIGACLVVDDAGGIIVEAEAYSREDSASHSFSGKTLRNASMFGPVGRAYIYRSYGVHWCLNFVCGEEPGAAVLVRAVEPKLGLERMVDRRGLSNHRLLCAGPGRLCQALGVTGELDGASLAETPFRLDINESLPDLLIGARVGVTRAADLPWRFGLAGSLFLSKPFNGARRKAASF